MAEALRIESLKLSERSSIEILLSKNILRLKR